MRGLRLTIALAGVLALIALAVAGCGGGADDDSSAAAAGDTSTESSSPPSGDEAAAEACFSPADVRILRDVNPGLWYVIGGPVSVYNLATRFANADAFARDARQAADVLEGAAEIDAQAAREIEDPDWASGLVRLAANYRGGASTLDRLAAAAVADDEITLTSARRQLQRQQFLNDQIARDLPRREACEE